MILNLVNKKDCRYERFALKFVLKNSTSKEICNLLFEHHCTNSPNFFVKSGKFQISHI